VINEGVGMSHSHLPPLHVEWFHLVRRQGNKRCASLDVANLQVSTEEGRCVSGDGGA